MLEVIYLDLFISTPSDPRALAFVLCETYPYDETRLNLAGYSSFFTSNDSYRTGGVAVYVRVDIPACRFDLRVNSCGALLVELVLNGTEIQLAAICRSPSSAVSDLRSFVQVDAEVIRDVMDPSAKCLLVGDVNICLNDSSSLPCEYRDKLSSRGFLCLNDPSSTRESVESFLRIDHAYGRMCDHVFTAASSEGVSDRRLINLSFPCAGVTTVASTLKTVRSVDYDKLTEHI